MLRRTSAIALATLLTASMAHADRTSVHVTASGDTAATDNVFSAPSGTATREADVYFSLRPGLLFTYNLPRMVHELTLETEFTYYTLHRNDPSVTARGGWRGLFTPGPRSELMFSAGAGTAVLSAISSAQAPDQTIVQLQPIGKVTTTQADASEYLSYVATREIQLSQSLFARASKADDNADAPTLSYSYEAGVGLGLERAWRGDSLALEVGASVLRLERDAPVGAVMGSRLDRQVNPRGRLLWRHDFGRRLSGGLDGGVAFVYPYGTDPFNPMEHRRSGAFPLAGAQLAYLDSRGTAQISGRRDVTPNLYIAQNTVTDSVTASGAMPLPWLDSRRRQPQLVGLGSLVIQRTQLVDSETSDLASSFGALRVDAGIAYTPRPGITYGARYELLYQTGDDRGVTPLPGFWRNTFVVTFAVRYPNDVAVQVPRRRSNSSTRADRKDLVPVGAEPVVPDLTGGEEGEER